MPTPKDVARFIAEVTETLTTLTWKPVTSSMLPNDHEAYEGANPKPGWMIPVVVGDVHRGGLFVDGTAVNTQAGIVMRLPRELAQRAFDLARAQHKAE